MTNPTTFHKRRRPPTFQHYPSNRAKKLKRDWVINAKIKSKWKAEKRKSHTANINTIEEGADIEDRQSESNDSVEGVNDSEADSDDDGSEPSKKGEMHLPELAGNSPPPQERYSQTRFSDGRSDVHSKPRNSSSAIRSSRRMNDSEHAFASVEDRTARHHEVRGKARGRGQKSGRGQEQVAYRGQISGREGHRGQSSGRSAQPNMKLRMNAILDKIKRDYT